MFNPLLIFSVGLVIIALAVWLWMKSRKSISPMAKVTTLDDVQESLTIELVQPVEPMEPVIPNGVPRRVFGGRLFKQEKKPSNRNARTTRRGDKDLRNQRRNHRRAVRAGRN